MEQDKYLRVTEVIKRLMAPLPPDVEIMSKAKGEIGTFVHSLIDAYLQGAPIFLGPQSREEAYFESWRMWYDVAKPEIIIKENRLFCDDLMITGQVDAVMIIDGLPVLVDYKTSSAEGKLADGSSSWEMQAHFYHYLLERNFVDISDKMLFLQLRDCKDVFLITDGVKAKIKPKQLSEMISGFEEADQKLINDKLKVAGEFNYESFEGKRKILIQYSPKPAKIFEYYFDKNTRSRCIEEAIKAWSEITEK